MTLSNTITAKFSAPGEAPMQALARWRSTRPDWLPDHYKEIEDSYKSVTWEWRHTPMSMKLVGGGLFGGRSVYRITASFSDDGAGGSAITVNGQADDHTYKAIVEASDSYAAGGIV
jgi:hypothetical protein